MKTGQHEDLQHGQSGHGDHKEPIRKKKFLCVFCHVMDDFLGCKTFFVLLLWGQFLLIFLCSLGEKNLQWQLEKNGCGLTCRTRTQNHAVGNMETETLWQHFDCCDSLVSVDMLTNDLQHPTSALVPANSTNKNCALSSRFPSLVW